MDTDARLDRLRPGRETGVKKDTKLPGLVYSRKEQVLKPVMSKSRARSVQPRQRQDETGEKRNAFRQKSPLARRNAPEKPTVARPQDGLVRSELMAARLADSGAIVTNQQLTQDADDFLNGSMTFDAIPDHFTFDDAEILRELVIDHILSAPAHSRYAKAEAAVRRQAMLLKKSEVQTRPAVGV